MAHPATPRGSLVTNLAFLFPAVGEIILTRIFGDLQVATYLEVTVDPC